MILATCGLYAVALAVTVAVIGEAIPIVARPCRRLRRLLGIAAPRAVPAGKGTR